MAKLIVKYLEILSNVPAENEDKNGKNYNRVTVRPLAGAITNPITGEVVPVVDMKARTGSFNQYEDSYLTPGQEDPAFSAKEGTLLPGAIISRSCTPYSFENKDGEMVNAESYTTIVFGDTSDEALFENNVKATFKANDHELEETIEIEETPVVAELEKVPETEEA